MKLSLFISTITVLFLSFTLSAQDKKHGITDPKILLKVEQAEQLMLEKSYFNAVEEYLFCIEKYQDNLYLNHQLATCYYKTRDFKNAIRYYNNAVAFDDAKNRKYPYDLFYLAESIHSIGEYENAKVEYVKFYKQGIRTLEFKEFSNYAKQGIKGCDYAIEKLRLDSINFKINHLDNDINHGYSDFSGTVEQGDLYFASLRKDSVLTYQYGDYPYYSTKIFKAEPMDSTWGAPSELSITNFDEAHSANPTFTEDGKTMYFTKCWNTHHNDIYCQIYTTHKTETGEWSKPHKLHHHVNNHSFSNTQPTLANVITGSSRRYDTTQVLYFVSNRDGGFGGYDIWYTNLDDEGKPSKPKNCGKKINSSRDEVTPYYNNAEQTLYFSSNYLPGFGGLDVFKSKGNYERWSLVENLDMPINSSYDDTYYQSVEDKKDTLAKGLIVSNRPGGMALKHESCCEDIYMFVEHLPEFINVQVSLSRKISLTDTVFTKDSVQVDVKGKKNWSYTTTKTLVARDTTVAFQGAKMGMVKKIYAEEAKKIGKFNPQGLANKIEWIDTNNTNGKFNTLLLKDKEYVMVIIADSMQAEMKEIVTSKDQVFEFEMRQKEKIVVTDTINIKPKNEITGTIAQIEEGHEIKQNQKFLLENMYFDTNKDLIKDASLPSLELLLEFLQNRPKVTIEIAGHTDDQGNDDYNLDLSQRRAESVKKYLIEHGVKEKRLTAKGYGESQAIAPNDTPENRQLNRRTEIIILSAD